MADAEAQPPEVRRAELRADVAQSVVAGDAAAELHLRLAGLAGRARRARPGSRPARCAKKRASAPTERPDWFMYVDRLHEAQRRPPCATSPANRDSGANATPSFARERVDEPEARVVARASRTRGPDCRGRRRVGSVCHERCHGRRRATKRPAGGAARRAFDRRRAAATYFFLSSLPCRPSSRPSCRRPSRRPWLPASPRRPLRAAAGAAAAAASAAAAGSSSVSTMRLRHDRRRDDRIELAARHDRHARRQLERRHVERVADVELRQVDLDELRQVLRQARDVELGHHVADDRAVDLHRRRDLGVDEVQRHLHVDLAVLVDALEVDVQDLVAERMHLHVAQQHLRRARRRASSSGSTRGTPRCAARGTARCGRARSACGAAVPP